MVSQPLDSPGKRLRYIRNSNGFTQAQFADSMQWKFNRVKDIEVDKQKLSYDLAIEIEDKYLIRHQWLLQGEGEPFLKRGASIAREDRAPYGNERQGHETANDCPACGQLLGSAEKIRELEGEVGKLKVEELKLKDEIIERDKMIIGLLKEKSEER